MGAGCSVDRWDLISEGAVPSAVVGVLLQSLITTRACARDQNMLMFRGSSQTRLLNDSTYPLRQGCPGGMKCRSVRSPAQSAIAAQVSSELLPQRSRPDNHGRRQQLFRLRSDSGNGVISKDQTSGREQPVTRGDTQWT